MQKIKYLLAFLLLIALLAAPGSALASAPAAFQQDCLSSTGRDSVIFGRDCTLASGQVIPGDLVVFGGNVTIESGATIGEDMVVFGGNVVMDGTLDGDAFILGGNIELGATAIVNGDVFSPGGNITRDPGAQILGNQVSDVGPFFNDGFHFGWGSWAFGSVVWMIFQALAMSAVAVLIALFAPDHLRRTAGEVIVRPLESGGLGCLTMALFIPVVVISVLTIIGPFIIAFVVVAALALGWVALGYELGRRMSRAFNQDWTIVLEAWVGTLSLGVIVSLIGIVPCIGWIAPIILGAVGLGAVLLSRFGTMGKPAPEIVSNPTPRTTPRKSIRSKK
jgi:hypothetical protein